MPSTIGSVTCHCRIGAVFCSQRDGAGQLGFDASTEPVRAEPAGEEGAGNAWAGPAGKIANTLVGSATADVMSRLRGTPSDATTTE